LGQKEIVKTKQGGEANQAAKSAATDALKRAARLFGVGRYLLDLPNSVKDEKSLGTWLRQQQPTNITELPTRGLIEPEPEMSKADKNKWSAEIQKLVAPLYVDANGKDNPFHMKGSLNKAFEDGTIDYSMRPFAAALYMLIHRAKTDFGMEVEDVQAALGGKIGEAVQATPESIGSAWSVIRSTAMQSEAV
jgi:hypothetical protein